MVILMLITFKFIKFRDSFGYFKLADSHINQLPEILDADYDTNRKSNLANNFYIIIKNIANIFNYNQ